MAYVRPFPVPTMAPVLPMMVLPFRQVLRPPLGHLVSIKLPITLRHDLNTFRPLSRLISMATSSPWMRPVNH